MKANIYKQSFWEFECSFLQNASCYLLGEVFLSFMENYQGVLFYQSTLAWKESTGFHLLWKQKQNLFSKVTYP